MKKPVRKVRYSLTPPPGYPTDAEWKIIEKKLESELPYRALPKGASPTQLVKQDLCAEFIKYCNTHNLTQRALAKKIGVTESRISEILHYHHDRFTIDKLVKLLSIIKPNVKLKVA